MPAPRWETHKIFERARPWTRGCVFSLPMQMRVFHNLEKRSANPFSVVQADGETRNPIWATKDCANVKLRRKPESRVSVDFYKNDDINMAICIRVKFTRPTYQVASLTHCNNFLLACMYVSFPSPLHLFFLVSVTCLLTNVITWTDIVATVTDNDVRRSWLLCRVYYAFRMIRRSPLWIFVRVCGRYNILNSKC